MRSIFKRHFLIQILIIIISFLILGIGVTNEFVKTFINSKKEALIEQGEEIAKSIKEVYYWGGYFNSKELNNEVAVLDKYLEASLIYIDNNKEISIMSSTIDNSWLGKTLEINETNIEFSEENPYFSFTGNMGGIFNEEVFTVAYPVIIGKEQIGTIFMNTSMTHINQTLKQLYKKIINTSIFAICISFVLISIFSLRVLFTIVEVNKTAKIIASGNLNKRIEIYSKDELGQLAQSFNEMTESLFAQEKKRSEFISNISHDIRSPLTSIKGFLQAFLDKTITGDNQEKYLKIVLEEVERLISLSNNLIELNKLQIDNELNYSEFDINEVIRINIINLETRITSKNIKIKVLFSEEITPVKADLDKIHRVIYNILDNALKFTPKDGEISIETTLNEDTVAISIKDNGCGISKENQKNIFDKLYKEDASRGQNKSGSGLGLSIVKDFILAHNQKITVKSEPNKGSEFVFTLERA